MAGRPKSKPKYLVFISHSKQDRWIARQISDLIEQKGRRLGISTFLDEKDIESGESIHESVRENIRSRDELDVLLSSHSVNRPWVLIEMGAAWALHKRIIAVVDKVTPEEMPDILKPYNNSPDSF